jgi:hypothetical protein
MRVEEKLRLRCLELAIDKPPYPGNPVELARKYYAFVKERDGDNVIDAAHLLGRRGKTNSPSKRPFQPR